MGGGAAWPRPRGERIGFRAKTERASAEGVDRPLPRRTAPPGITGWTKTPSEEVGWRDGISEQAAAVSAVALDLDGNVVVVMRWTKPIDLGNGPVAPVSGGASRNPENGIIVAKLSPDGHPLWTRGAYSSTCTLRASSVAVETLTSKSFPVQPMS